MFKRAVLIAMVLLVLTPSAFAQEETVTAQGNGFTTTYEPGSLGLIFSSVAEENGYVSLYYADGNTERLSGIIYGRIRASPETSRIIVEDGGYISPPAVKVNISAQIIIIDAADNGRLVFGIENGIYARHRHAVLCKEDCAMTAVVSFEGSDANITGSSLFGAAEYVMAYEDGENSSLFQLSDFHNIIIKDSEWPSVQALPAREGGTYDTIKVESGGPVSIYSRMLGNARIHAVLAQKAKITAGDDSNVQLASTIFGGDAELVLAKGQQEFLLQQGRVTLLAEEELYSKCAREARTSVEEAVFLANTACLYASGARTKVMPKQGRIYGQSGDSRIVPLKLKIIRPQHEDYKRPMLTLEAFKPEDTEGKVIVERRAVEQYLTFSLSNVMLSSGDWFDLGTSFEAYVYEPELGKGEYNYFMCDLIKRECYLDNVQVSGFEEQHMPLRCETDEDCGAGRKCDETLKRCVRQATCAKSSSNRGGNSETSFDLVVMADGYDDAAKFSSDVAEAIDIGGAKGTRGLYTVEPFKRLHENERILLWELYNQGARMPAEEAGLGLGPSLSYVNMLMKQCPQVDRAVIISNDRNYRSYSIPGGNVAVSMPYNLGRANWALVIAHELGHGIGVLWDEYVVHTPGIEIAQRTNRVQGEPNCLKTLDAREKWAKILGSDDEANEMVRRAVRNRWFGCGGDVDTELVRSFYRSSYNSIMRHHDAENEHGYDHYNKIGYNVMVQKLQPYAGGLSFPAYESLYGEDPEIRQEIQQ